MTGVYRQYPSQQPKRYDATVFAPAANPYLIGPSWDLRATLRRDDPEPQTPVRPGPAVFTLPVASVPPAQLRFVRTDSAILPQTIRSQASLQTPAGAAFLIPPEWDLRAAYRREDARPQTQASGLAALDDTVIVVTGDAVQPLAVFARERPDARGLPLNPPGVAPFATQVQAAYIPPGEVLQIAQAVYPQVLLSAPELIVSGPVQYVPPVPMASAVYLRTSVPIAQPESPLIQQSPADVVPSTSVVGTSRIEAVRITLQPNRMPSAAPQDAPISVPPVQGAHARLAFKWPQPSLGMAAVLDSIPPVIYPISAQTATVYGPITVTVSG